MKVCQNSLLSICSVLPFVIASTCIGIFDSSPALASHQECKKIFGHKVCVTVPEVDDIDPTRFIPGSKEAVEQAWGEAGAVAYQGAT